MAHHKRKKARAIRAGCKMCKPWKYNGECSHESDEFEKFSDHRRRMNLKRDIEEDHQDDR